MRPFVALDWGTSSLRGARLAADGTVVEERAFARGILTVEPGRFAEVFEESFGDWMSAPNALCLIGGMAGSKQGWFEAPYCPCPAGLSDVASKLAWVQAGRIAIVPGLSCERAGVPDVMRGEETQVFGALELLGIDGGTFVLPGTHSKWVRVEEGRVIDFSTSMTGEFYALLRRHSILARTMPADDPSLFIDAFDAGVAHALDSASLLQSAFSVRTLALFDRLAEAHRSSFLSGVVIGEELRSRALSSSASARAAATDTRVVPGSISLGHTHHVVVIGDGALTQRYQRALSQCGMDAVVVGTQAAWQGLRLIAMKSTS